MRSVRTAQTLALAVLAALALAPAAHAEGPYADADAIAADLFDARSDLILDGGALAARDVADARSALRGSLAAGLRKSSPANLKALQGALDDAARAVAARDEVALAAARGEALGALRRGAYDVAIEATSSGQVERARAWLLIRDFRQITRFTRPGVDATAALDALETGEIEPDEAVLSVRKDLYDAYQTRLTTFLDEAEQASQRGYDATLAESAALATGYWQIISPEFESQRSMAAREAVDETFAGLAAAALQGDDRRFRAAGQDALEALDGFTASPFTPEEEARRAQQFIRFLDLVPIEYERGTNDGEVTLAFEIQEALAFSEAAQEAFTDLEPALAEIDAEAAAEIEAALVELEAISKAANEGGEVASQDEIESFHETASAGFEEMAPEEWLESSSEADFDLVDISLDQMEAAVSAGEREQAEQARLSAYAFFEFGPERLLRALDPALTQEIEGYVWFGANGTAGLAELIADDDTTARDVRDTRLVLDEALEQARGTTGEGASDITVVTNAALIVFREGLEAILIIAAITASMVGANRRLRRPVIRGALIGLPASAALFLAAVLLLDQLAQYGEKLEAIVGIVAVLVLILVLNWFFHKVYWTEWIASHRKRSKLLTGAAVGGVAAGATVAGLYFLGFTSVFREGFETVLFLQALQLESGTPIVLAGVSLGLLGVFAVGALTFRLEQKLPYKRMLIVTGVLMSLVLVVMVGNTLRTLQGVGWLSITPIDAEFPLWMGTWLGIFPTWETLGGQIAAFAFVIGSYYAAEWVRKRHVRRALANARSNLDGLPSHEELTPTPIRLGRRNGHAPSERHGASTRLLRTGDRARDDRD